METVNKNLSLFESNEMGFNGKLKLSQTHSTLKQINYCALPVHVVMIR